jgi:uncharacterized protein (TIGR03067 family)
VKTIVSVALGVLCVASGWSRGEEPPGPGRPAVPGALIRSARSGAWSAPETWESGKVPGTGARVQVRAGHTVTYDLSSDRVIRSIHVAGTLTFARDRDTRLDVGLIKIQQGEDASEDGFNCDAHVRPPDLRTPRPALEVGTADEPIPAGHTARIRLVAIDGMDKESCPAIVCCGGRMDLHGAPMNRTWVKLGADARGGRAGKGLRVLGRGDIEIRLAEPVTGWRVGDRIIVTTTISRSRVNQRQTLRPGPGIEPAYTEQRTIKAIHGDRLTLERPLDYPHQGTGDYRAEVADLSRNVIVESADPARGRGHTMYHRHSSGSISYAEFRHLGKEGVLGKYPIHIHLAGDTMRGSYVLGASIWDSGNRWVTVHGTNYFIVRDCVGYQSVGHGFYLEDGTEVFNVLDRNLGVQAFAGKPLPQQFLPFDHNDGAAFWWANSLNTFTRNVAVECDRYGFRFEATPVKGFDLCRPVMQPDGRTEGVDVRTLPFVRFVGNEAHDQLFGINLGGLGGDFFKGGVDGVVPDHGSPFVVENTRIWNTHWAFAPHTRYAVDNLDIAESTYGLFLPAYDAEGFQSRQRKPAKTHPAWGRMSFRLTEVPVRLPDALPKYFGQPFDIMEFAGDTLPPTSIITHVHRTKSGGLLVRGTASDNEAVEAVRVNGHAATATAPNFAEWEVTLEGIAGGDVELTACAVDDAGNVEPRPHRVLVRLPRGTGQAQAGGASMPLNLPPKKRGDGTVKPAPGPGLDDGHGADAEAIQGIWQVVCQRRAGRATGRPQNMVWVIDGKSIWLVPGWLAAAQAPKATPPGKTSAGRGGKRAYVGRGLRMRFALDPAKAPKQIDIDGPGKAFHYGVYTLAGDELTVCMGASQQSPSYGGKAKGDESTRPTTVSPEAGTVVVLRRVRD